MAGVGQPGYGQGYNPSGQPVKYEDVLYQQMINFSAKAYAVFEIPPYEPKLLALRQDILIFEANLAANISPAYESEAAKVDKTLDSIGRPNSAGMYKEFLYFKLVMKKYGLLVKLMSSSNLLPPGSTTAKAPKLWDYGAEAAKFKTATEADNDEDEGPGQTENTVV